MIIRLTVSPTLTARQRKLREMRVGSRTKASWIDFQTLTPTLILTLTLALTLLRTLRVRVTEWVGTLNTAALLLLLALLQSNPLSLWEGLMRQVRHLESLGQQGHYARLNTNHNPETQTQTEGNDALVQANARITCLETDNGQLNSKCEHQGRTIDTLRDKIDALEKALHDSERSSGQQGEALRLARAEAHHLASDLEASRQREAELRAAMEAMDAFKLDAIARELKRIEVNITSCKSQATKSMAPQPKSLPSHTDLSDSHPLYSWVPTRLEIGLPEPKPAQNTNRRLRGSPHTPPSYRPLWIGSRQAAMRTH